MKKIGIIYIVLIAFGSISCNYNKLDTKETEEKLKTDSSSRTLLDKKQEAVRDSLLDIATKNMEIIADKLCSGMKVDEIYNFQLDGRSIGYYMSQDTNQVDTKNLEAYNIARRRAQCCLDATVQHKECKYLSK